MVIVTYDQVNVLFSTLCFFLAISVVVSWLNKYSLQKLASGIDVKNYFDTKLDVQPAFSVCVTDPQLNEKVKKLAPSYNKSTYIQFLRGDAYHEELKKLEFEQIAFNWSQHFHQTPEAYIVANNGTKLGNFPMTSKYWKYYTSYIGLQSQNRYLTNCLAVEPLTNEVHSITITLKRSIFNEMKWPNYKFRVLLHYPHQIIRSYSTSKYLWRDWNKTKNYQMTFLVRDVEVLQRHQNKNNKCIIDWDKYDEVVLEKHLEKIGCRSPYQNHEGSLRNVCSSKKRMKQSLLYPSDIMMKMFDNPCRSLEKADYRYMEAVSNREAKDIFEMKFIFNGRYREIVQYEQIDLEVCQLHFLNYLYFQIIGILRCQNITLLSIHIYGFVLQVLFGNVGGSVGIILGWAIISIPAGVKITWEKIRHCVRFVNTFRNVFILNVFAIPHSTRFQKYF